MITAVYARVSTGMQAIEGTSLDGQVDLCIQKAKELNVVVADIKVYREEGFSGEDIDRPVMNELREDIRSGLISQIIITHPDRLSRDLTDKLFICREIESKNVNLLFVDTEYKNTPEGQLFFNLISVIAQYELSLIKKRTIRGRIKAVEKDKKIMPMRVPPFGYDLLENRLVINEIEARYVELIFKWYVFENLTMREIGNKLVEMGAEPKRAESKNWSASSIQNVLKSEIYIGKYFYNRRHTQKLKGERTKNGAPKRTYTIRDKKDWILVEIPPVIDEALFKQAQKQRVINTKNAGNVKYEYLLKSLLRCGHCGRKWEATTYSGGYDKSSGKREKYRVYRCPNKNPKIFGKNIQACPSRSIRAETIDAYVWALIMEVISDPEEYIERLNSKKGSLLGELALITESIQKQISVKEKEAEKIKILFKKELIDEDEMEMEFRLIKDETRELKIRFNTYKDQIRQLKEEATTHEENVNVIEKINNFIQQNGNKLSFEDRRFVVNSLVDELLIRYGESEITITAVGYLDELRSGSKHEKNTRAPMIVGNLKSK